MKKANLFLIFAISTLGFSINGELKTGGELSIINNSKEETETSKSKILDYSKAKYQLNLIDLNLTDKNSGFNFGTILKSSRENLLINDYDGTEFSKKEKPHNHDIQGKLFLNWNYSKNENFNSKIGINYYLANYLKKKIVLNGNIQEEDTFEYEFLDGTEKYLGGDTHLFSNINYTKNGITISNELNYTANHLVDYKKGKPKFTSITKLKYDDKENIFEFAHNFDLKLRSFAVPYNAEKRELEEVDEGDGFDIFDGNFVRRYKQNFDIKYTKKLQNEYIVESKIKNNGYYIAENTAESDTHYIVQQTYFDLLSTIKTPLSLDKNSLNLSNTFGFESKFEDINMKNDFKNNTWEKDLWALIMPTYKLNINSDLKFDNLKIKPDLSANYTVTLPMKNRIFDKKYIVHTLNMNPNFNLEYIKDNLNIKSNFTNELKFKFLSRDLTNIEFNPNQKIEFEYSILKNLTLKGLFNNNINFNTTSDVQKRLYADTLKLKYNGEIKLEYEPITNLKFNNSLKLNNNHHFVYILDGGNTAYFPIEEYKENIDKIDDVVIKELAETDNEEIAKQLKDIIDINRIVDGKTRKFKNEAKRLLDIQRYSYTNNLEYTYKTDKLTITPSITNIFELNLIALTNEMTQKLRNREEDDKEKRIPLETSDSYHTKYNIGGKIEISPKLSVNYNFTDNMKLDLSIEAPLIFEKKVINQINDKKRTDDKTFGPKDRNFKLRSFIPKFGINYTYKW